MDNLWVTVGEGEPHLVFVAHMDELGLVVEDVTPAGRLKVSGRGGFVPQMYEGRPVVVYTERGDVNGIVEPRKGYLERGARRAQLDLNDALVYAGVDSAEAVLELGIRKGDFITIRKTIGELTPDLLATRAVDDRAGCAVLLAAAHRLNWDRVRGKTVTFAWDVQEETGLVGARRLAGQLGADYVFAVDTFVSTDAPLDDKRFARIPLGEGLVIRGMDSSTIAPRHLMEKVMAVARKRGIPFHLGNTRGSTDGTRFIPEGAVSIPLSWPGTYSHSFIEKIHRKDLQALTDLVVALVADFH
jgi:putative aminopeptidase FrvX